MINRKHIFTGKIDGQNIAFDRIKYEMKGLQPRINFVNWLLNKNDTFLMEYFDKYFVVNPNCWDALSHENNICMRLEQLGTYLLSEIPDKKSKLEYKFHNGERNFMNCLRKEYSLDKIVEDLSSTSEHMTDGDVMYMLERDPKTVYTPKDIRVLPEDLQRQDELGEALRQYDNLKQNLINIKEKVQNGSYRTKNDYKPNTYKVKHIIGLVDGDMLDCKKQMTQTIIFNQPLKGSSVSCWDDVDFLNPIHVECFLKLTSSSTNFDSDLSMLLNYFNMILKRVEPQLTDMEKQILLILRWGNRRVENINFALETGYQYKQTSELYCVTAKQVEKIIQKTVSLFILEYINDVQNYIDARFMKSLSYNPLTVKTCAKCGKTKHIKNFYCKNLEKGWYRSACNKCLFGTKY